MWTEPRTHNEAQQVFLINLSFSASKLAANCWHKDPQFWLARMEQLSCKEDVTMPQDIEKRFQHLVNEWFSFQKRAGFLGSSKEVLFSNLTANQYHIDSCPLAMDCAKEPQAPCIVTEVEVRNCVCTLEEQAVGKEYKEYREVSESCLTSTRCAPRKIEMRMKQPIRNSKVSRGRHRTQLQ
ncbi:hypothetical protein GOP47_0014388 [Adiantum capillus-veneris]|uniref:Uncharacterized protein n=1 Tax=Adiantum capillus-veneris TaxID=13818 RepID=A0A9D4ZE41_ADICA|nr:hypothetical protein GOP47_0014388 [Adiantum capillus-veneris]